jgi:hypothetical protein
MFLVLLIGSFSHPAEAVSPEEEIIERLIRLEEGQKALNDRFGDMNDRFGDMNHRIDDLRGLLYVILAGMFALVGFVIWDRRTALSPAIRRTAYLEDALKEFAKKEPKMAEVLRHLGIM